MTSKPGLYLSVPRPEGDAIITRVEDREDAEFAGVESFVMAGFEAGETIYATLYRIAENGGLASSECFPISGPEAA